MLAKLLLLYFRVCVQLCWHYLVNNLEMKAVYAPDELVDLFWTSFLLRVAVHDFPDAMSIIGITYHCPHLQLIHWNSQLESGGFRRIASPRGSSCRCLISFKKTQLHNEPQNNSYIYNYTCTTFNTIHCISMYGYSCMYTAVFKYHYKLASLMLPFHFSMCYLVFHECDLVLLVY